MMRWQHLNAVLACLMVAPATVAATASPMAAELSGTQILNPTPTDQAFVRLLGGSSAGVLYTVRNFDYGTSAVTWVKPASGPAFTVPDDFEALAGSLLFDYTWGPSGVRYRTITDPRTSTCPRPDRGNLIFLPTGWVASDESDDSYHLVTVGPSGCTSRLLTKIPNSALTIDGDSAGFLVAVWNNPGGDPDLVFVPMDDPTHPMPVPAGNAADGSVSTSSGAVVWAEPDHTGRSLLHRWTVTGGTEPPRTVNHATVMATANAGGAIGYIGCPGRGWALECVAGTVQRATGEASEVRGVVNLTSDGATLYFSRFSDVTAIDRGTSVSALTRLTTIPKLPPGTWGIAVGASRVAYVDTDGAAPTPTASASVLHSRSYAKSGGTVVVGAPANHGAGLRPIRVAGGRHLVRTGEEPASASKLWLRTEGAPDRLIFASTTAAVVGSGTFALSGTRALWTRAEFTGDPCGGGCPQYDRRSTMLYDARTGLSTRLGDTATTKFALWGSYLVWANRDGAIHRRDLSTGQTVLVKPAGKGLGVIGVWGSYVGWSGCVTADCRRGIVAFRNHVTGAAAVRVPTTLVAQDLRMTGGHLVYAIPTSYGGWARQLRELRLGTSATATIANLLIVDSAQAADHFDAHDETLAWISPGGAAQIGANSAYVDRPRYLGNALASSPFTPNGDGSNDRWTVEFPISKALPTCAVTIKAGTTVVRTLGCATATGRALISWDGRNTAGKLMPKGRYAWTLTGRDSDGSLLWWNGSAAPIAGTVLVS